MTAACVDLLGDIPDDDPVLAYLGPVVAAGLEAGEVYPLGSDAWISLAALDVRKAAAVARSALRWYGDGLPPVIERHLRAELDENNWLTAWRLRRMSGDLSEAEDWSAVASWTPLPELQRLRLYGTEAVM